MPQSAVVCNKVCLYPYILQLNYDVYGETTMLNNFRFVDLTHTLDEHIPTWPGSVRFQRELRVDYPQGYLLYNYLQTAGIGTHMDAPAHFVRGGRGIADIPLTELIASGCVLDVRTQVQKNADYKINADDIAQWEKQYGLITQGALVLACTGWSQRWPDEARYRNADDKNIMRFPGFGADAATLLVERGIVGVGIDTLSLDNGSSTDYAAHHIFLGNDLYQLENLTALEQLPATGACLFALPIKIKDGPEAAARVIALVPNSKS